ncbi:hypothetical protein K437DRAFT_276823 [Tilletiaria anomala UBC 951]|uniref:DUF3074 domain-containing protein n=1 Tax=Tilletiaria anomala (strain ATCC 24038 / CBS 436.72 / UBC 951) TaxID=1037660 RepID=A0A066V4P3_TILAU|nr:uncharacterized protein K437DRAFT_276823 [Tilletiaria anomala UBC 951]KDN36396.1 hypothetical protein K437DRAFT_276823 [Tilletiaria anomala UBC 951]
MATTTEFPLNLTVTPFSSYPTGDTAREEVLRSYTLRSIALTRESLKWKNGKKFTNASQDGGHVQTFSSESTMSGREGNLSWHGRTSIHTETKYEAFRAGLLLDHSPNEAKYIHAIRETTKVDSFFGTTAEVWRNGYKLPIITKDRDFVELIITVDLPAHASPFSEEHEALVKEQLSTLFPTSNSELAAPRPPADDGEAQRLRSFLVISVPVSHDAAPQQRGAYIRGRYVSVEAVAEQADGTTAWRMSTQSDPAGRIPTWLTERSLPSKIAEDVPSFVKWVRQHVI